MPNTRPQVAEHVRGRQLEAARRRLLDGHSVRHRRPARQDVPDRLQRDQRPHDRRKRPGTGRLRQAAVVGGGTLVCAIAYDTRHRSRHFAELCAEIMVAAGFTVYFLDGYRSTPELSFAVRHSAVLLRHHGHGQPQSAERQRGQSLLVDRRAIAAAARPGRDRSRDERARRSSACRLPRRWPTGRSCICQEEVDAAYQQAVLAQSLAGPARSEDHLLAAARRGRVGASCRCWRPTAFSDVEVFGPHAEPDGDFPNVPGHVSNPENPATFDVIIERAQQDRRRPDPGDRSRLRSPRLAAPKSPTCAGSLGRTITGNQIGALLAEYVLDGAARPAGTLDRSITSSKRWSRPR